MTTESHFGPTFVGVVWILGIAAVVSVLVAALSARQGAERGSIVDRVLWVWFAAALLAVAILTLRPGPEGIGGARPSILNPFARIDEEDALANVLLYVPIGFFAALIWRSKSHVLIRAASVALGVSVAIEFAQAVLPIDRAATTHDVVFNALGGLVGAALGGLVVRTVSKHERPALVERE